MKIDQEGQLLVLKSAKSAHGVAKAWQPRSKKEGSPISGAILALLRIWYNVMNFFKGERRTIYESSSRNGKRRNDNRS